MMLNHPLMELMVGEVYQKEDMFLCLVLLMQILHFIIMVL